MDGGRTILDDILGEGNFEEFEDVEMADIEEGEFVEENLDAGIGESNVPDVMEAKKGSGDKNQQRKRKNKKKKNKRKGGTVGPKVTDVNRFVLDVCKRLRERKSYLVYTAVGCLGVSALSDLVKEVYAIQACGGQKTSDGSRFRNGGGILWNIIKAREPNAYKEIMKKGKEFEKQFRPPSTKREPVHTSADQDSHFASEVQNEFASEVQNELAPEVQNESERLITVDRYTNETKQLNGGDKRAPVHERLRIPVTYGDLLEREDQNNK